MVGRGGPLTIAVLAILLIFSVFSWAIIFSKWNALRTARSADRALSARLPQGHRPRSRDGGQRAVQARPAGVRLRVRLRGGAPPGEGARAPSRNKISLERSLQLGISEELTKLERNMSWLATTASVSPFIGLFGTVLGIIRAFQELGHAG